MWKTPIAEANADPAPFPGILDGDLKVKRQFLAGHALVGLHTSHILGARSVARILDSELIL